MGAMRLKWKCPFWKVDQLLSFQHWNGSFVEFSKNHEVRIPRIDHLIRRYQWSLLINSPQSIEFAVKCTLAFVNCSRLHEILPKNPMTISFCEFIKNNGIIRCTSYGYWYQSSWMITSSTPAELLQTRWPISHVANTKFNAQTPQNIDSNSTSESLCG